VSRGGPARPRATAAARRMQSPRRTVLSGSAGAIASQVTQDPGHPRHRHCGG
jgi:hypothetical protein